MFVLEMTFDDSPERLARRPAHREKLAALAAEGRVLAAGPLADGTGALVIFAVDSRDEVAALMADDPYYESPGVSVVGIREWHPLPGVGG